MLSSLSRIFRNAALVASTLVLATAGAAMAQSKVAVITPYLAQPGTQVYVEAF